MWARAQKNCISQRKILYELVTDDPSGKKKGKLERNDSLKLCTNRNHSVTILAAGVTPQGI
jgi:hypothetical protein